MTEKIRIADEEFDMETQPETPPAMRDLLTELFEALDHAKHWMRKNPDIVEQHVVRDGRISMTALMVDFVRAEPVAAASIIAGSLVVRMATEQGGDVSFITTAKAVRQQP